MTFTIIKMSIPYIKIIGRAKYHFLGFFSVHKSAASFRHSANTSAGIIFIIIAINPGNKIISSKRPITGIKSGIKSIGDSAYTIATAASIFAGKGVFLFFNAINTAGISVFNYFALSFNYTTFYQNLSIKCLLIFIFVI